MTTRRDVRTLLEEAGTHDVPAPRPEFVAALEARLLGDTVPFAAPTPITAAPSRIRTRSWIARPALVGIAASIAAVVLAGALAGWFGQDATQRRLQLAASHDTLVVLPDGSQVDGTKGLDLPEGTVVKTGPNGHATIGPVDLGPGQVATVTAGRLQISVTVPSLPPVTVPTVTTPTVPALPIG